MLTSKLWKLSQLPSGTQAAKEALFPSHRGGQGWPAWGRGGEVPWGPIGLGCRLASKGDQRARNSDLAEPVIISLGNPDVYVQVKPHPH